MARKRWDKYRQQAVKRITNEVASIEPGVSTGAQAFGVLAAKQAVALMDSEKPKIADLERLGRLMTGHETGGEAQRANERAQANAVSATPDTLLALLDAIDQHRQAAIDKARAIDGTADNYTNDETA